jgi:nitrite reductase/ring-hydroxylating ferredoxin subunit
MTSVAQAEETWQTDEIRALFDVSSGYIDRRLFEDEALYKLELERIFARGWNFVAHESQIPHPGDYFITYIGADEVIVARDRDLQVNVMINSCRHRGNTLCRAEFGRAGSFLCSYHGWNFGLNGDLIAVPGIKDYYNGDFDKSKWGLRKAAKVEGIHGFYFATFDADAPSLHDYLGDVGRAGLGMAASRGELELIDGIQKNTIDCNWKFTIDNQWDWYHVMFSHSSASASGFINLSDALFPDSQLSMLGEYGHAIGGPGVPRQLQDQYEQMSPEQREAAFGDNLLGIRAGEAIDLMGKTAVRSVGHPLIFPNFWVFMGGAQCCLRIPRGPRETEIWWFTFARKGASPEERASATRWAIHMVGPTGLLEQDDGENWSHSTRGSFGHIHKQLGHTMSMGLNQAEVVVGPGGQAAIEGPINEHPQRWFYQAWVDWMTAKTWAELKANHTPAPIGRI